MATLPGVQVAAANYACQSSPPLTGVTKHVCHVGSFGAFQQPTIEEICLMSETREHYQSVGKVLAVNTFTWVLGCQFESNQRCKCPLISMCACALHLQLTNNLALQKLLAQKNYLKRVNGRCGIQNQWVTSITLLSL